jgi:hypothetical protein
MGENGWGLGTGGLVGIEGEVDLFIPTGEGGNSLRYFPFRGGTFCPEDGTQCPFFTGQPPTGQKGVETGGRDGTAGLQAQKEDLGKIGGKGEIQMAVILLDGHQKEGADRSIFPGAVLDRHLFRIYIKQVGKEGHLLGKEFPVRIPLFLLPGRGRGFPGFRGFFLCQEDLQSAAQKRLEFACRHFSSQI